jgi:uncharacterized protein YqgC (DUF456 family)
VTFTTAAMIVIGLVGVVVPVLPGVVLIWAGVAVWALARHDATGWVTLAVATAVTLAGLVVKYVLPGRRLRAGGVGPPTLAAGAALGVVGFFVIPVVGLVVGFVLGIYLAELIRLSSQDGSRSAAAWTSTRAALVAVGWSMAIELTTGLLVATCWLLAVLLG